LEKPRGGMSFEACGVGRHFDDVGGASRRSLKIWLNAVTKVRQNSE